jgi:hypothetical protein
LVTRATRSQREIWYMESGPSRVNAPLKGPVIPRSRKDLFKDQSFGRCDNAGINTSNSEWACKGRGLGGKKGRHTGVGVKCL